MKTALLLSGGMDSLAIAWWKRPDVAITIDYGQKAAEAEKRASSAVCQELGIEHHILTIDGTPDFVRLMDQLLQLQEGGLRVEAPAIGVSTADLIRQSGLPASMLAWAHSCHKANTPCWNCRGCNKYRETYDEVSVKLA